jgi:hypothetical protein
MLHIQHTTSEAEFNWGTPPFTVDNIAVDAKGPLSTEYLVSYTTSEDNHCDTQFEEWPNFESAIARAEMLKPFTNY